MCIFKINKLKLNFQGADNDSDPFLDFKDKRFINTTTKIDKIVDTIKISFLLFHSNAITSQQ